MHRATAWPNSGVVKCKDGTLLTRSVWDPSFLADIPEITSLGAYFPIRKPGRYYLIGMLWGASYYHWICDVLPRLLRDLPRLPDDVQIVLPSWITASHREWLRLVDFPFQRSVQFAGRRPWKVDELFHTSPIIMTGDHLAEAICGLRDRVLHNVTFSKLLQQGKRERLFVNRVHGQERSIENMDDLLPLLQQHEFRVIHAEHLSLEEQIAAFRNASLVVGPHGGGFTNILWCQRGTQVFELFEPESVRRCYKTLCAALELEYFCAIGSRRRPIGATASMSIDPDSFSRAIQNVASSQLWNKDAHS